ncbi:cytochrome c oxidase subunit II [Cytophagaceae bacterium YF14B1]|uniref:Cytochrome c oxidase subunit 2 n=1 Tax=Xanthocytophaga flava TaxID=3048013 RepID=A0AAE3U3W8_9BACT|nr:cytochrome c oxidase subunit II [Xanthocytophaga flavus]MDJ1479174.1 cytochrome c oxidase subunit II [Xanthocytophaga flavus]
MITAIIVTGLLLIVAILVTVFRVQSLISITKKADERVGTSNKVNAVLFPVFLVIGFGLAIWISFYSDKFLLPEASSTHGKETDNLFWITMGVIGAVFFATHILLFWFPFQYQYKKERRATFYPHNNNLEVVWTIIPGIVLTTLVISGWWVWRDIMKDAPEDAVVVELVGKQFNWIVRYPGDKQAVLGQSKSELGRYDYRLIDATNEIGIDFTDVNSFDDFTSTEIHIPKGKPVLLKIHARDVLHSVFMPHFRLKMDAVPGMQTRFWFVPEKTTAEMRAELGNPNFNYELACTEVCGRGHFSMRTLVVVDEPAEYAKWVANRKPFLAQNRDYLKLVPANLKEKALQVVGPEEGAEPAAAPADSASAPAVASVPVATK